jgi:hypothetical protein
MSQSSWDFFDKTMYFLNLQHGIMSARLALSFYEQNRKSGPYKNFDTMVKKGIRTCWLLEKGVAVQFSPKGKLNPGLKYFYRLKPIIKELQIDGKDGSRLLFNQLGKTKKFLKNLNALDIFLSKEEILENDRFLRVLYNALSKMIAQCIYRQRNSDWPIPL